MPATNNDMRTILGLSELHGSVVDDAVEPKLDTTNRAGSDFESNDLGDPAQVSAVPSSTDRLRSNFEANTAVNPSGSNFDTKLQAR